MFHTSTNTVLVEETNWVKHAFGTNVNATKGVMNERNHQVSCEFVLFYRIVYLLHKRVTFNQGQFGATNTYASSMLDVQCNNANENIYIYVGLGCEWCFVL